MTPAAERSSVAIALAAVYLIWGSTYLAIRHVVEALPALLSSGLRYLAAGAILYVYSRVRGAPPPSRREWLTAFPLGALFFLVGNGCVALAERHVTSGLAAVACAATPIFTCVMALSLGERPSRLTWIGIVVGFAGVVLLALGDLRAVPLEGALLLLAPPGWALGSVLSRRLALPKGPMAPAIQMVAGGLVMLVAALLHGDRIPPVIPLGAALSLGYLMVFGSIVGFSAYSFLIRHTTTALATSYAYVNPVLAVLLGAALGGERPGVGMLAPGALVLLGVVIVVVGRTSRRA